MKPITMLMLILFGMLTPGVSPALARSTEEYPARIIELVDGLDQDIAPVDFTTHLLPIKKAAGWAWVQGQGRTTLSGGSRRALLALLAILQAETDFLRVEAEVHAVARPIMELLEITTALERDLR